MRLILRCGALLGAAALSVCLCPNATAQKLIIPGAGPAAQPQAGETDAPSYAIGLMLGQQLASQGCERDDFQLESLMAGLKVGLAGEKPELDEQQLQAALQKIESMLQQRMQVQLAKEEAMMREMAPKNLAAAKEFLEKNAKAEGVVTTASGLQYKVVQAAPSGASPKATDMVRVHYTGRFLNGNVFDSSVERGMPAEFPLNQVVKGWTEALQLMKVGEKYIVYLPPNLAYGERGRPPKIGPNEALVFEIELLDILQ
jgi:FKBP-type peptidyl-prolyl cis-trans isomerase FklB